MGTPFLVKTIFLLCTVNNAGQLAPLSKDEWTAAGLVGPVFLSSEQYCLMARGKMP